jgi:hypothetical protein
MRPASLFARLPIRIRVAATFALVVALLLVVAGVGLYVGLGATLRSGIDDALRTRAADVAAIAGEVADEPAGASPLTDRGESIAQVLTPGGGSSTPRRRCAARRFSRARCSPRPGGGPSSPSVRRSARSTTTT